MLFRSGAVMGSRLPETSVRIVAAVLFVGFGGLLIVQGLGA